jgi:CubicO group peptidase (beta-lactamase class C family)
MTDTDVVLTREQRRRAAAVHVPGDDGAWRSTDMDNHPAPEFYPGGHALYSTPLDYLRLQRALLRGGELFGRRVLREDLTAEIFRDHLDGAVMKVLPTAVPSFCADLDLGPGYGWSLGLMVATESRPGLRRAGSAGWAGVYNTFFWVDPASDLTVSLYTQTLPFYAPEIVAWARDFERAVYA